MTPPVSHVTNSASRPVLPTRASRTARMRHPMTPRRAGRSETTRLTAVVSAPPPAIETTEGGW